MCWRASRPGSLPMPGRLAGWKAGPKTRFKGGSSGTSPPVWNGWPTKVSLLDSSKNTMLVDWVRAWELQDIK